MKQSETIPSMKSFFDINIDAKKQHEIDEQMTMLCSGFEKNIKSAEMVALIAILFFLMSIISFAVCLYQYNGFNSKEHVGFNYFSIGLVITPIIFILSSYIEGKYDKQIIFNKAAICKIKTEATVKKYSELSDDFFNAVYEGKAASNYLHQVMSQNRLLTNVECDLLYDNALFENLNCKIMKEKHD